MAFTNQNNVLVIATRNRGKLEEISELLAGLGVKVKSPADFPGAPEPEETGSTYEENAAIKARALCDFTGLPSLADDSGLEVDALDGNPGVTSARYAGPEQDAGRNRRKLLEALGGVPPERRGASFVCVMSLALPDGRQFIFRGECRGSITSGERGSGGFGYDPVFYAPELGMTMAEMPPETKNRISHRGRALQKVRSSIEAGLLQG